MIALQKIKNKLTCLKQTHINQPIFQICNNDNCNNPYQLCCYLCQQQNHKLHEMINIKIFIYKIINIQQITTQALILSATIDNIVSQIINIIYVNKSELFDVKQIIGVIDKFMEIKTKFVMTCLELPKKFQEILDKDIGEFQKQLVCFFKQYNGYFDFQEKQNNKTNSYLTNLKNIVQQLKSSLNSLQKLIKQSKFNDKNILMLFPIEQMDTKVFKPYFSQLLKGTCMKVTPTTAQMITSGSQRILALQPSLQNNNKIKKWRIKITKLASWIGVGICHINKLKQANWNFNYSSTNHGSYFISSNGYSWSSYKPQFNSKFQSFQFKTGDTIALEYNPRQKKLKFTKQQQQTKNYMLEIENNGDPVYPAVNLTGINDSVEIIY